MIAIVRRLQITVCGEGWYYLVVLAFIVAGAMMREINLMIILAAMMVGPLLLNVRQVFVSLRRLEVTRKLPQGVSIGDVLTVELSVANRRRRGASWALVLDDRIERIGSDGPIERATARAVLTRVAAGQSAAAFYRGKLAQRGRYRFGPLTVSTRFPFGLVRRKIRVERVDDVVVCPRLGHLSPHWLSVVQAEHAGSQRSRHRQGLMEGDFYGLRDWRSGDSRRWIHWRTTAKRDRLSVRQFEQQHNQDLVVLLELYVPPSPTPLDWEHVETAASLAATIAAAQCRLGNSELLLSVAAKRSGVCRGSASAVLMQEVMEQLAVAEADSVDRLPKLLEDALDRAGAGRRMVLVSTRPVDLADTGRFEGVWQDVRRRASLGRIACVDVSSDEIDQFFHMPPGGGDAVP